MDEYVMMRLAELLLDGKVEETIQRCMGPEGNGGNFGAMVLEKNAELLKQALSQIELVQPGGCRKNCVNGQ